jgi:hypothetical protein
MASSRSDSEPLPVSINARRRRGATELTDHVSDISDKTGTGTQLHDIAIHSSIIAVMGATGRQGGALTRHCWAESWWFGAPTRRPEAGSQDSRVRIRRCFV